MTIHTQKLKNGGYKIRVNHGQYTCSCTHKNKKTAFKKAMAGLWGLLDINNDPLVYT